MTVFETIDLLLSFICVLFALIVVLSKNPIVSAFALLMTFIGVAGIYFQLGALFLTAIQILVYAGAIAILFIFVLMLMNLSEYKSISTKRSVHPVFGIIFSSVLFGILALVFDDNASYLSNDSLGQVSMLTLFERLFLKFMVPFELATVMLLAAIVGVIFVAKRES